MHDISFVSPLPADRGDYFIYRTPADTKNYTEAINAWLKWLTETFPGYPPPQIRYIKPVVGAAVNSYPPPNSFSTVPDRNGASVAVTGMPAASGQTNTANVVEWPRPDSIFSTAKSFVTTSPVTLHWLERMDHICICTATVHTSVAKLSELLNLSTDYIKQHIHLKEMLDYPIRVFNMGVPINVSLRSICVVHRDIKYTTMRKLYLLVRYKVNQYSEADFCWDAQLMEAAWYLLHRQPLCDIAALLLPFSKNADAKIVLEKVQQREQEQLSDWPRVAVNQAVNPVFDESSTLEKFKASLQNMAGLVKTDTLFAVALNASGFLPAVLASGQMNAIRKEFMDWAKLKYGPGNLQVTQLLGQLKAWLPYRLSNVGKR